MDADLEDLTAFLAVAKARGLRDAARTGGTSASTLSEAVRRLETRLGMRLLHRTTRSVTPTEAGAQLIERLTPALGEVEAALNAVGGLREGSGGLLRLNVPVSAARLVLPSILPSFLAAHPGIRLEIVAEDSFVDVLAGGCDAGIRYDDRLEQDMIALPIGPRRLPRDDRPCRALREGGSRARAVLADRRRQAATHLPVRPWARSWRVRCRSCLPGQMPLLRCRGRVAARPGRNGSARS